MIKLDKQEMDEAIDRAIEKFRDDYVPLYDGPYYAKSTLRRLCIMLIVELCETESGKVKDETYASVCSDPDHVKCPHCGHIGVGWDDAKEWYCLGCGRSLPDE